MLLLQSTIFWSPFGIKECRRTHCAAFFFYIIPAPAPPAWQPRSCGFRLLRTLVEEVAGSLTAKAAGRRGLQMNRRPLRASSILSQSWRRAKSRKASWCKNLLLNQFRRDWCCFGLEANGVLEQARPERLPHFQKAALSGAACAGQRC